MTLTADHFPLGLARLFFKSRLLSFDPAEFANHRQPHRVIAHPQRHGYAHPSLRRIHAQMEVLDRLAHNLNPQTVHGDLAALNTHFGSSPVPEFLRRVYPARRRFSRRRFPAWLPAKWRLV